MQPLNARLPVLSRLVPEQEETSESPIFLYDAELADRVRDSVRKGTAKPEQAVARGSARRETYQFD